MISTFRAAEKKHRKAFVLRKHCVKTLFKVLLQAGAAAFLCLLIAGEAPACGIIAAGREGTSSGAQTVTAVKNTAAKSTAVKNTAVKNTAAKNPAVRNTAANNTAAKNTAASEEPKTLYVSASGKGYYNTIQAAVDAADPGDTIVILPGTYEEAVDCKDKNIHIRGISRDDCILKYSGLDYFNPPLEMATGTLENLTIIAENSGTPGAISGAYCLHADFDTQTNGTLVITNVHFINEVTTAVGIATRPHFCALLVNCTIEARGDGPALFTHDWEFTPEESGNGTTSGSAQDVTGQGLDLRNCSLTNTAITSPVIVMDSQELAPGCAVIRYQNDTVKNLSGGAGIGLMRYSGRALGVMGYLGGSDWVLAPDSSGNSDPQMNAATYSAPAQIAPSTGIVAPSDELLEEAAENVKNRYASDGTEDENDSRTNR